MAGLALCCFSLYMVGAGGYDLLTDDEMRYAEAGRIMATSGDWIVPEYNGYFRFQKPILFYWLQAAAQWLLGSTLWAARLPTALAGTGVVLLTAHLGRRLWGVRAGLWSGIVLASSVEMVLLSRMVMTDVVLLLFIQCAITSFCLAQLTESSSARQWLYRLMYVWLAFGVLTKGPVAVVLPAAVIGPWLAWRGRLIATLRELQLPAGLLILLCLAGPWYALAHWYTDGKFTWHFFLAENFGRFTANVNKHEPPIYLYLILLLPMTFPWAGILPQALWAGGRATTRQGTPRQALPALFIWQVVLVIGLFSLSKTRVWTYTLPMFPALALLAGHWLADALERTRTTRRSPLRIALWFFCVVALGMTIGGDLLALDHLPLAIRSESVLGMTRVCLGALFTLSLVVLILDHVASLAMTLRALVGGVAGWYVLVALTLAPAADQVLQSPVRTVAHHVRTNGPAEVVTYNVHELNLNFHTGLRIVRHWREGSLELIAEHLQEPRPIFVLFPHTSRAELETLPIHVWGEYSRFLYGANIPPPGHVAEARRGP